MLADVEEILNDETKINAIAEKIPKNTSNIEKRIDELLKMAGNITYEDYISAIKKFDIKILKH